MAPIHGSLSTRQIMNNDPFMRPPFVEPVVFFEEALRNELLEYGHYIELLRDQQKLILEENLMELPANIEAISQQINRIEFCLKQIDYWEGETLCSMRAESDLPDAQLMEQLPENHRILIHALLNEISLCLSKVDELNNQNQQLELRSQSLR